MTTLAGVLCLLASVYLYMVAWWPLPAFSLRSLALGGIAMLLMIVGTNLLMAA